MSTPRTLIEVVRAIEPLAKRVEHAAFVVQESDGDRQPLMALLRATEQLGRFMWDFANESIPDNLDPELKVAWRQIEGQWELPAVVLAIEWAIVEPQDAVLGHVCPRYKAAGYAAEETAKRVLRWAAHPPTEAIDAAA